MHYDDHIVKVFGFENRADGGYIFLETLNRSLYDIMKTERLTDEELACLASDMLKGAACAHGCGRTHGDLHSAIKL